MLLLGEELSRDDVEALAMMFKALGDPTRLSILMYIMERGEVPVQDIAKALDKSISLVSHHLSCLRNCGLVKARRVGKNIYYSIRDKCVYDIVRTAIRHSRMVKQSIMACEVLGMEGRGGS